jgi:hypothetical protein
VYAAEVKKPVLKSYQIPYRLTDTNHVLVRVKINNKGPFNFIIDTGAPALFVATSVANKLGIKPDKAGWGNFDRFEIEGGAVEIKARGCVETPFQVEGINALGLAGTELHGIIGYSILGRYRMEFDFTRDKMRWTRLNYDPGLPKAIKSKGQPAASLDAIGSFMKVLALLLEKKPPAKVVPRGFLGIELAPANKGKGVLIKAVLAKSPAALAGLQSGDVITEFQGDEVSAIEEVQDRAARLHPGQKARFTVHHKGTDRKIVVKAGEGL